MSFLGSNILSDQSSAGRAAIYIGAGTSPYTSLSSLMYSVGACDGTVSISTNQDIIKLNRSDGQNPYAVLETAYDFQVTFNLQETDIFNLALACGYDTAPQNAGAFTDDNLANYSPLTTSHHGVLESAWIQETVHPEDDPLGVNDPNAIDEIIVTNADPDTLEIQVSPGSVLDGLDHTPNTEDWIILSGITNTALIGLNGIPIKISSGEELGQDDTLVITSTAVSTVGYFAVGPAYGALTVGTHTTGLGRLRRVIPLDMIEYDETSSVKTVRFDFGELSDAANFNVGDFLTLRGTQTGALIVNAAIGSPSVNLNREINNYPLRITDVTGDQVTCALPAHSSHTGATDVVYNSDDNSNNINMGYLETVKQLVLGSDSQAGYRSMMIRVEGGQFNNSGAPDYLERQVAEWQFYKCKLAYGGSVDYDRTGAVTYPVVAHCLSNSTDVVGRYITPSEFTRTNYYGDD
jgi:hypothetical protein